MEVTIAGVGVTIAAAPRVVIPVGKVIKDQLGR